MTLPLMAGYVWIRPRTLVDLVNVISVYVIFVVVNVIIIYVMIYIEIIVIFTLKY